jgi:hypothetical protein
VRRIRCIALLVGVAAAAVLLAPAAASAAGTFTWSLAQDFTATGSGANPDHDQYGATPWTYVDGPASLVTFSHDPSGFKPLTSFATGVRGGLAGWSDPNDSTAFIGINPTGTAISQAPITYPAHTIAIQPPGDRLVAVGWTSPFAQATTVSVSGTIANDSSGLTCTLAEPQWSLDQNGTQLVSGGAPAAGASISQSVQVPAHGTIYLTVIHGFDASCSNVSLSLTIQAAAPPPAVTLDSPAQGAVIGGAQPTFAGRAGQNFGDAPQITVRIYSGSSVSGSPVQTLTTTASAGAYQVPTNAPLANGTYTAQAEQDDILTPPVSGSSQAVTFSVENGGPNIKLNDLGSAPLSTATPTLSGSAGTNPGDTPTVGIAIYSGSGENGRAIRVLTASVGSGGGFSAKVTPALPDGTYTAIALQKGAGGVGISQPITFVIRATPASSLALTYPASGASIPSHLPVFAGTAGNADGDSATITVTVYKGASTKGTRVGRATTTAVGGKWSLLWTRQLALGLYTVQASQSDATGHVSNTPAHRFLIVPGVKVIGSVVTMNKSGAVSVPLTCYAPPGVTCQGDLLIVTHRKFRAATGGPLGRLRLLFQFVQVPGGKTVATRGAVSRATARILRHRAPLKVDVTLALKINGRVVVRFSSGSTLRVR